MQPLNELSPDACGVIATVIPIYLLLLWAGSGRLMPRIHDRRHRLSASAIIVLWTTAEVVALYGAAAGGLTGGAMVLVMGSAMAGVGCGALVMIVRLWREG